MYHYCSDSLVCVFMFHFFMYIFLTMSLDTIFALSLNTTKTIITLLTIKVYIKWSDNNKERKGLNCLGLIIIMDYF